MTPIIFHHITVIGRIPGDDEDSCYRYENMSRKAAITAFEDEIYAEDDSADRDTIVRERGVSVFINHISLNY